MPQRILYLLQNMNTLFAGLKLYLHLTICHIKKKVKNFLSINLYLCRSYSFFAQDLSLVLDIKKIVPKCVYCNIKLKIINFHKILLQRFPMCFLSSNFTISLESISQGVFCQEENASQEHRDYRECVTVLEEAWRRFKKTLASLGEHLSEGLLPFPVILCREDLKSISVTERSCRELYNNHLQIWQSKVRIVILQFISFDILSVISLFPHKLFILRGRWHTTCSLTVETAPSFTFLPLSLFLSLSFCLSGFFWLFLPSLHASFMALFKGEGRILLAAAWHKALQQRQPVMRTLSTWPTPNEGSQGTPFGMAGLYFKHKAKLCSFHFQRAWAGLWGALKSKGGASWHSCWQPGCGHICTLVFATQLPGEQMGHDTCMVQKSPDLIFIQPGFSLPALSLALVG